MAIPSRFFFDRLRSLQNGLPRAFPQTEFSPANQHKSKLLRPDVSTKNNPPQEAPTTLPEPGTWDAECKHKCQK